MNSEECTCQGATRELPPDDSEIRSGAIPAQRVLSGMERCGEDAVERARMKGKGKLREIQEAHPETSAVAELEAEPAHVEIDDLTCAICLEQMKLADTAIIKGCEHSYCATCILSWKVVKEQAGCPQCKAPFTTLYTYRSLDGTLRDFPQEESVCLLARAQWFAAHAKEAEKGRQAMAEVLGQQRPQASGRGDGAWDDYGRYFEEYDDDEEVENYYFSAAAGRARIVLGNRRWGENGYVSAGRQHARPRVTQTSGKSGKGKSSAAKGKATAGAASPSTPAQPTPSRAPPAQLRTPATPRSIPIPRLQAEPLAMTSTAHADDSGASPSTPVSMGRHMRGRKSPQLAMHEDGVYGTSPGSDCGGSGSQGRRARRAAKKAAADARVQAAIPGM